jgi:hypothetical protein
MSMANQMTRLDARHIAKQEREALPGIACFVDDISMIACITFGPMIDDARFVNPKSPKNCTPLCQRNDMKARSKFEVLHAPCSRTLVETVRPSPFVSMQSMVFGANQTLCCTPRTPTRYDIFNESISCVLSQWEMSSFGTYPSLSVQIPIMPQRGSKTATTFVVMS